MLSDFSQSVTYENVLFLEESAEIYQEHKKQEIQSK